MLKKFLSTLNNSEFVITLLEKLIYSNSPRLRKIFFYYKDHPSLFLDRFIKIKSTLDETEGKLLPYHNYILDTVNTYNHVIGRMPRQSNKTTICLLSALHYSIFNENSNVCIVCHNYSTVRYLRGLLFNYFKQVPSWLGVDLIENNDQIYECISLSNGSNIFISSYLPKTIEIVSLDYIIFDELAFFSWNLDEVFWRKCLLSKILILSTAFNNSSSDESLSFNEIYKSATQLKMTDVNDFIPITIHYNEVNYPSDMKAMPHILGEEKFIAEFQTYD